MSFLEYSFITSSEYESLKHSRVKEKDFQNTLYVAMFSLMINQQGREAAKAPIKIMDKQRLDSGTYLASLSLLDRKLRSVNTVVGEFVDGYWIDSEEQDIMKGLTIERAYIREPRRRLDGELIFSEEQLALAA